MTAAPESSYEDESLAINYHRIPIASGVFLLALGGTGIVEFIYRPQAIGLWLRYFSVEAVVVVLPLLWRRKLVERRIFEQVSLASWVIVVVLIHHYSLTSPIATMVAGCAAICLMTGMSLLTWWTIASQAVLVVTSCLAFTALILIKGESGLDITLALFCVFAAGIVSIQGNLYLDLHRRAIWREALRSDEEKGVTRALEEFARELNHRLGDEGVEDHIAAQVRASTGAEWVLMIQCDPADEALRITGGAGHLGTALDNLKAVDLRAAEMPFLDLSGNRMEVGVIDDWQSLASPLLRRNWSDPVLLVPLVHRGETIGVLIGGYRSPSMQDHRLLRGIGQHAAIALANVRLFDELRRASAMKSEFLATMSHELRTPLHVIMGYTEMLGDILRSQADPEVLQIVRRLEQNEMTLTELIEGTLDAHRLEAGRTAVKPTQFEARALFEQLQAEVRWLPRTPSVQLQWDLPDEAIRMFTDAAKLKVVAKNLVGNALKFTKRGFVHVSVRRNRADRTLQIVVSDTGPGIAADEAPHIFEMFRQASPTASESSLAGVGLGLFIVREFVKRLHGTVELRSSASGGAEFAVAVPLKLPAEQSASTPRLVA